MISAGFPQQDSETVVNIDVDSELLSCYMEEITSYKCKECSYISNDRKIFNDHCLQHLLKEKSSNETFIYLCSTCGKAFNSVEDTKSHMSSEHKVPKAQASREQTITEQSFSFSYGAKENGKTRIKSKHKPREKEKFLCRERGCTVTFQDETLVECHEKCHVQGDSKIYRCFECDILFNNWPKCVMHLFKYHNIDCGLLTCSICQAYKTWAPLKLENHMRIHGELRAFPCKVCWKSFKQASQLRTHQKIHSLSSRSDSKQCTLCFKMYADSKALKKHKNEVHSKLRPFVCNVCGHASARRALLAIHQRQHTGHKPLACSLCPYVTADHNSLRTHKMRHTGVRPYNCPACPFSSIRSSNYIRHVKSIHPGDNLVYACDNCTYKTVSEENYMRHISDHLTGLIKDGEQNGNKTAPKEFEHWLSDAQTKEGKEKKRTSPSSNK